jgi:hypothetical protein
LTRLVHHSSEPENGKGAAPKGSAADLDVETAWQQEIQKRLAAID